VQIGWQAVLSTKQRTKQSVAFATPEQIMREKDASGRFLIKQLCSASSDPSTRYCQRGGALQPSLRRIRKAFLQHNRIWAIRPVMSC
jgi:hypothetical protein